MQQVSTDKLMNDLRAVVTDAEELLKATAARETGERVEKVRARAEESLRRRARACRMPANPRRPRLARPRMKWSSRCATTRGPQSGLRAGVGLVLGILLGRR